MTDHGRPSPVLPAGARVVITATTAAALAVAAATLAALPAALARVDAPRAVAAGVTIAVLATLLHKHSPTLAWKGHRIAVHPAEALLFVGALTLPVPVVVLALGVGTLGGQWLLKRSRVKATFNTSTETVSASAGAATFTLLAGTGVPPVAAAGLGVIVFSVTSHFIVAGLLAILAGDPFRRIWAPGVLAPLVANVLTGILAALLALALFAWHPAAALLVIPIAYAFHRLTVAEHTHRQELATRRALTDAWTRLPGARDVDAVLEAAYEACRETLPLRAFRATVVDARGGARSLSRDADGGTGDSVYASAFVLRDAHGDVVGTLSLTLAPRGDRQRRDDDEASRLVAAWLEAAVQHARAVERLAEDEERLRGVMDAARDPIAVTDAAGHIAYANRAARAVLGPDGLQDAWRVLGPGDRARVSERLRDPDGSDAPLEVMVHAASGAVFHMELSFARTRWVDGEDRVLVVGRDLTERRRLEHEARHHREAAIRAERLSALGTLVASVAHEINNPLTYVNGNTALARMSVEDALTAARASKPADVTDLEDALARLKSALAGGERITRLTRTLKVVAKGTTSRERTALDVNEVVQDVEALLSVGLPDNVTIRFEPATRALTVTGNAAELHQVLLNLAKNAVEAVSAQGGTVRVRAHADASDAVLEVVDDGPGLPEGAKSRLFTPFFTTKNEGTGLGLAIVYALVTDHGGRVDVESEPGKGTRFSVRVPLVEAAAKPSRDRATAPH